MTLVKRNEGLFPNLWNDFFDNDWFGFPSVAQAGTSVPAVNIKESDENYELEMAAPGMKKSDFEINLDNNVLTISSEIKEEKTEKDKKGYYTQREFNYHSFSRSFTLPENVKSEKISASYNDGVLKITIPKNDEAKIKPTKKIKIL